MTSISYIHDLEKMKPLINILIRSHRPEKLKACLSSISEQTYENKLIWLDENGGGMPDFTYNGLCNKLKAKIDDGWFFFLDDDDTLWSSTSLAEIAEHLANPNEAVICQFSRNGWLKPTDEMIKGECFIEGQIGMPCLFLHHSQKDVANIPSTENGDFLWISEVVSKLTPKYVPVIVVNSPQRSRGK